MGFLMDIGRPKFFNVGYPLLATFPNMFLTNFTEEEIGFESKDPMRKIREMINRHFHALIH